MTPTNAAFALIHSPLVGTLTWEPAARQLIARGYTAVVPSLSDTPGSDQPFWRQHADSAKSKIHTLPPHQPLIYVAHSGAGALLPAIRKRVANPVAGYIFVDAGLPKANASRLDTMGEEDAEWAEKLRNALAGGASFPAWRGEDLRDLIRDDELRRALVASIQPRGLLYFVEPIPVFGAWPDAPCGYIRFSAPYDYAAGQARSRGWPVLDVPAGHFHMLVDPQAVASAILKTAERMLCL